MTPEQIKKAWDGSDSQYDFAKACYQEGVNDQITKAREIDPVLNGVLHVIENFIKNQETP